MTTMDELIEQAAAEPAPADKPKATRTRKSKKIEQAETTATTEPVAEAVAATNGQDEETQNALVAEWDRGETLHGETEPQEEPAGPIKTPKSRIARATAS